MKDFFNVYRRNSGREKHWDIGDGERRAFRIRGGEDGAPFTVCGEGKYSEVTQGKWLQFNSLSGAMAWISDYFMHEPPQPKEQENI